MHGTERLRRGPGNAGLTFSGVLITVCVLLVTAVTLVWMHGYISSNTDQSIDAARMRTIYGAMFLYASSNNDTPPSSLLQLRRDLSKDEWLEAVNDPWAKKGPIERSEPPSQDPAFPDKAPPSPVRISFTYLPMWTRYGGVKVNDWRQEMNLPQIGVLASYWYGEIDRSDPDGRSCSGPVVRIDMDGAARTVQRRNKSELTASDLFGIGR
jgi:hypothetical protein